MDEMNETSDTERESVGKTDDQVETDPDPEILQARIERRNGRIRELKLANSAMRDNITSARAMVYQLADKIDMLKIDKSVLQRQCGQWQKACGILEHRVRRLRRRKWHVRLWQRLVWMLRKKRIQQPTADSQHPIAK